MSVNSKMKAIADAIRAHTGGTDALTLDAMAEAIAGIQSGGVSIEPMTAFYAELITPAENLSVFTPADTEGFNEVTNTENFIVGLYIYEKTGISLEANASRLSIYASGGWMVRVTRHSSGTDTDRPTLSQNTLSLGSYFLQAGVTYVLFAMGKGA